MREIIPPQIGDGQLAEDVVGHGRGHLDRSVALHGARRFKAGEGEGVPQSSSGTPYWSPSEMAIAKSSMMERNAAPSLCMFNEDSRRSALLFAVCGDTAIRN